MTAALDLLSGLVLEDGHRWGDVATPVQWRDAEAILTGPAPYFFGTKSRGYSKSTDNGGCNVAEMLDMPDASRCYGLASDRDQAARLVGTMGGLIRRTPELQGAFEVGSNRVTVRRTGTTFEALAADAPGAWGLLPRRVIVDELAWWPDTAAARLLFEAVTTALVKVDGSRMSIITAPSDPAHWSYQHLVHARTDPLWAVSETTGPAPWLSRERLESERRRLSESSYRRLFEGEWCSAEDRLVADADLTACVTLDGPQPARPGVTYRVGVDLGLRSDRTVIAVCHAEAAGDRQRRVVLDRMVVLAGTKEHEVRLADVEEAIVEVWRSYGRPRVRFDPWQALGLMQRLRGRGVEVEEFTFSATSVGRLASVLHLLLRDHLLALPDDAELLNELRNVRLRETSPGVVRLDHDSSQHDDRAVATALAATALVEREGGPVRLQVPRDSIRRPPIIRTPPSQRGTRKIGRFTIPNAGYQPPEREGRY